MWSLMPSEPAAAENCGSKLISAPVSTTCSVLLEAAAAAGAADAPRGTNTTTQRKLQLTSPIIEHRRARPPPRSAVPNGPIRIIASHTGGEPTRVVISGAPELGKGDMEE